jgi:Pyruvate/2-oxoacid:ferredoxin oxidoreductase delta subunit
LETAAVTTSGQSLPNRPPGAQAETEFLASGTRCAQCLKVCPTNVMQPAALEAGLEGVFTPRLDFTRSYCEWTCSDCGTVCPTQSIAPLTVADKQETVIGLAVIDRSICLPWAKGEECLVCEELCPTPEKAITFGAGGGGGGGHGGGGQGRGHAAGGGGGLGGGEGTDAEGDAAGAAGVKLPRVRAPHCIGCGICQYNCPVQEPAAIVVRAVEHTTVATEG